MTVGVQRFVYVSYAGVEDSLGSPLDRAKLNTERLLEASSMRTVIVRPDAFQEIHLGPLGRFDVAAGKVAVFGKGDTRRRWVAVEDVAQLVAAPTVEPDPPGVVEFGGPEALSRNEAAAVAERLTGRRMRRQRMPRLVARLGLRLLDKRNDALASIFGVGLHQDLVGADWDGSSHWVADRGLIPRPVHPASSGAVACPVVFCGQTVSRRLWSSSRCLVLGIVRAFFRVGRNGRRGPAS